ncbi:MAG TPA: trigger factor [Nitrospirota bacterium]|nr:trigger factor [Nitrospirota bacterium]
MRSAVENISTVKKKITIEVPQDDVAKEREKAVAKVAKKAKLPGFRPGKAPRSVVERHYGEDIQADVMNKLIADAYFQAVQEHKISPVDLPEISDVSLDKGSPLSFSATVEVRPNIELGTYDGIEVKEEPLTVSDEELEQTINRLREMYAQLEVVEGRPAEKGDSIIIDFEGFREGKSIAGAKASDHMLTLGSGNLIPGFEDQLVGVNKGEAKEISVSFPADYTNKDLAGKDAVFKVMVKEIKRAVMPEVNDDFAKDIGNHNTVEELRARVKEDMEARKRDELASSQREELLSKLVDAHTFDVPPGMVERELQAMMKQQAVRLARQGMDVKSFDAEKYREERLPLAERRVKGLLILDAVADREKVTVIDEELSAELQVLSRKSGQPVETIKKYYESQEGGMDNLRSSLIQEKTLTLLLSRAKKGYN